MQREQERFQRPDREALLRVLAANRSNLEGIVLRLAWKMGLSRDEIRQLTWTDISFPGRQIILPDRVIPMDEDTRQVLEERYEFRGRVSPYVVISERHRTQVLPESISRMARTALNKGGLPDVSLTDLRRDYIISQLEEHDWRPVSAASPRRRCTRNFHPTWRRPKARRRRSGRKTGPSTNS